MKNEDNNSDFSVKKKSVFVNTNWILTLVLCAISIVFTYLLVPKNSSNFTENFYEIDRGLKLSNEIIDSEVDETIKLMNISLETYPQFQPLVVAAKNTHQKVLPLLNKIKALRIQMTDESGGIYSHSEHKSKWQDQGFKKIINTTDRKLNGKPVGYNNKNVPHRIFIEMKEGANIRNEIIKARKELLNVIEDLVEQIKREPIRGVKIDPSAIEVLKKDLAIREPDDYVWKTEGKKSWEAYVFNHMSVFATYSILRKFENDASVSVLQIVNFIKYNLPRHNRQYPRYGIFSQPKKGHIFLGETFETEIVLGSVLNEDEFTVSVNDKNIEVVESKAKYLFKPTRLGPQKYSVTVSLKNKLTGQIETTSKEFEYMVIQPTK